MSRDTRSFFSCSRAPRLEAGDALGQVDDRGVIYLGESSLIETNLWMGDTWPMALADRRSDVARGVGLRSVGKCG
jgi:hypothetical protein